MTLVEKAREIVAAWDRFNVDGSETESRGLQCARVVIALADAMPALCIAVTDIELDDGQAFAGVSYVDLAAHHAALDHLQILLESP